MDTNKTKPLKLILAFTQIAVAVFNFDLNDTNKIIVSILLVLGALMMLSVTSESPFLQTANKVLSYVAVVTSIALVIKVLVFD